MAKVPNLEGKGFDERTAEEQREIARQGGKASGEARRRKRDLRLALEMLLEKEFKDKHGNALSGAEAIATKQFEKAMKGDTKAFEVIRDTAGQKPVDKIQVSEITPETQNSISRMLAESEAELQKKINKNKKA